MKYKIEGEPMAVVTCELEAGESMITESGSMVWMSPNMEMQTSGGGLGKMFGRMFSGENLFQNIYTAQGGAGMIAFAASFPGSVVAVEITPDKPVIVQKSAFLAGTAGVELSVFFQKRAWRASSAARALSCRRSAAAALRSSSLTVTRSSISLEPVRRCWSIPATSP